MQEVQGHVIILIQPLHDKRCKPTVNRKVRTVAPFKFNLNLNKFNLYNWTYDWIKHIFSYAGYSGTCPLNGATCATYVLYNHLTLKWQLRYVDDLHSLFSTWSSKAYFISTANKLQMVLADSWNSKWHISPMYIFLEGQTHNSSFSQYYSIKIVNYLHGLDLILVEIDLELVRNYFYLLLLPT